jgi:hypothetical protein
LLRFFGEHMPSDCGDYLVAMSAKHQVGLSHKLSRYLLRAPRPT